jgi:hypothetical protein
VHGRDVSRADEHRVQGTFRGSEVERVIDREPEPVERHIIRVLVVESDLTAERVKDDPDAQPGERDADVLERVRDDAVLLVALEVLRHRVVEHRPQCGIALLAHEIIGTVYLGIVVGQMGVLDEGAPRAQDPRSTIASTKRRLIGWRRLPACPVRRASTRSTASGRARHAARRGDAGVSRSLDDRPR